MHKKDFFFFISLFFKFDISLIVCYTVFYLQSVYFHSVYLFPVVVYQDVDGEFVSVVHVAQYSQLVALQGDVYRFRLYAWDVHSGCIEEVHLELRTVFLSGGGQKGFCHVLRRFLQLGFRAHGGSPRVLELAVRLPVKTVDALRAAAGVLGQSGIKTR